MTQCLNGSPTNVATVSPGRVLTFLDFKANSELLENEYANVYEKRLFFVCDKANGNIMTKRLTD